MQTFMFDKIILHLHIVNVVFQKRDHFKKTLSIVISQNTKFTIIQEKI